MLNIPPIGSARFVLHALQTRASEAVSRDNNREDKDASCVCKISSNHHFALAFVYAAQQECHETGIAASENLSKSTFYHRKSTAIMLNQSDSRTVDGIGNGQVQFGLEWYKISGLPLPAEA